MGRPKSIDKLFNMIVLVEALADQGLINSEICKVLGISETTLYKMQKDSPEFAEALKRGKENPNRKVEEALISRALGYSHPSEKIFLDKFGDIVRADFTKHYPPDVSSCIFFLKNRMPEKWKDSKDINIGTPEDSTYEGMKTEDLLSLISAGDKKKDSKGKDEASST